MATERGSVVERIIRANIKGVVYEAKFEQDQEGMVRVYAEPLEDGEVILEVEDVEVLMNFLEEFLQTEGSRSSDQDSDSRDNRSGSARSRTQTSTVPYRERAAAQSGDQDRMPGGQGRVKDPEHDARLKGNEDQRPNDPDRERNREGGRRGGSAPRATDR